MSTVTEVLTAICNAISEFLKNSTASKDTMSESEALKQNKRYRIAVDYAEKIIFLADEIQDLSTTRKYKFYRKKFFKYNS